MPEAGLRRVQVGVRAEGGAGAKVRYALEELLTAALIPHRVSLTEERRGWDLLYSVEPPEDEAVWMAADRNAWQYLEHPGRRVERVETVRAAGQWMRLPVWGSGGDQDANRGRAPDTNLARHVPDLAAAAFFFFSCWEEWQAPERDRLGRYPLAASVFGRGLWGLTECPVEQYALALRSVLAKTGLSPSGEAELPKSAASVRPTFVVGLSHDIDSVRRWDARGFARAGRQIARSALRAKFSAAAEYAGELLSGIETRFGGDDPYENLGEIVRLEQERGASSTFFFLARHSHRLDGTHPAHYQRVVPRLVKSVATAAEIGVHASTGAVDAKALRMERERLEALAGRPLPGVRFHNLRGGPGALPHVAAAGFCYDSTLGFAEEPGFRTGIARPFRPYDRGKDRPLDLVEVPLMLMDTTLISPRYLGLPAEFGRQRALAVLEAVRRWGGAAALLWHNDNLPRNEAAGYAALYTELIDWTRSAGGRVASLGELVDEWIATRAALAGE